MLRRLLAMALCFGALSAGCPSGRQPASGPDGAARERAGSADTPPATAAPGSANHVETGYRHKDLPLSAFELVGERPVPIAAAPFVVSTPGGDVIVEQAQLVEAHYQRVLSSGSTEGPAGGLKNVWCYEIKPANENIHWTWAVCIRNSSFDVGVVSDPSGAYFAWMDGPFLCFEPIGKPRDRATALEEFQSSEDGVTVRGRIELMPTRVFGTKPFDSGSPVTLKVDVKSIERDAGGNWTVRFTGKDPDKVFTMVGRDGEWRRG